MSRGEDPNELDRRMLEYMYDSGDAAEVGLGDLVAQHGEERACREWLVSAVRRGLIRKGQRMYPLYSLTHEGRLEVEAARSRRADRGLRRRILTDRLLDWIDGECGSVDDPNARPERFLSTDKSVVDGLQYTIEQVRDAVDYLVETGLVKSHASAWGAKHLIVCITHNGRACVDAGGGVAGYLQQHRLTGHADATSEKVARAAQQGSSDTAPGANPGDVTIEQGAEMSDYLASVFISYSHADKPLALALRDGLDAQGCRVWVDEGELRIGDSLVERISEALDRVDFVAVLVSEASVGSNWCRKEVSIAMTGEIEQQGVTVLPLCVDETPMPETLKDKLYLPVDRSKVGEAVDGLLRAIRQHLNPRPELPPRRRTPAPRRAPAARPATADPSAPIKLTGIDTDGITRPRNGGSRGSALYTVPFTLSTRPAAAWAELLVRNWDHPASFTTMHRPGIARVVGDRVLLEGTTVEEVEQYHLTTLKSAVEATNAQFADAVQRRQREEARQHQEAEEHRRRVDEAVRRLNFDA